MTQRREFFVKRNGAAEAVAAAIAGSALLLFLNGSGVDYAMLGGGAAISAAATRRRSKSPALAIDDAGIHRGGRHGYDRLIPADEIAGWSLDHDRKRFAIHLRSGVAFPINLWGFARADQTPILLALEEHRFVQIKVGEEGRAAIRRAQIRDWKRAVPVIAAALLICLVAVVIARTGG